MKCCGWRGGRCPRPALDGGYCEEHAGSRRQTREEIQKHYRGKGSSHERNRVLAFRRDGWKCVRCGWRPRVVREYHRFPELMAFPPEAIILAELTAAYKRRDNHLQAHHILDVESRPDLADDLANLSTLCKECHAKETGSRRG